MLAAVHGAAEERVPGDSIHWIPLARSYREHPGPPGQWGLGAGACAHAE